MRTDGWDMTKLTGAFFDYANAPKKTTRRTRICNSVRDVHAEYFSKRKTVYSAPVEYAAGIAQTVLRHAMDCTVRGSKPQWRWDFPYPPEPARSPPPRPSYTMDTESFPGIRRSGRGVNHPPLPSAEVKEMVELYLYSTSVPSWPVPGWTLLILLVPHNPCFKWSSNRKANLLLKKQAHSTKLIMHLIRIYSHYSCIRQLQPLRVSAASFWRFRDHTQGRTTVGRTPLDEWSARRRDLYLTTHTKQRTTIHAPAGIRTRNTSKRSAVDARLRPLGHCDRHLQPLLGGKTLVRCVFNISEGNVDWMCIWTKFHLYPYTACKDVPWCRPKYGTNKYLSRLPSLDLCLKNVISIR
jgi:hypothetical protein